jgi:hypothetical protein
MMGGRVVQRRKASMVTPAVPDSRHGSLLTPPMPETRASATPDQAIAGSAIPTSATDSGPALAASQLGHSFGRIQVFPRGDVAPGLDLDRPPAGPVNLRHEVAGSTAVPPSRFTLPKGAEVVRPALHPPATGRATRSAAGPASRREAAGETALVAGVRGSRESQDATMDPVDTEDEKVNYLAASTPTFNDLTPTGSSGLTRIRLSDVAISGEVYEDAGQWKIRVTAASTTIHWGINSTGYSIPNPVDGGNITQANWQTVVRELQGYQARQAAGSWHHPDATRTHELNHVDWFKAEITRTWPAIETDIQSHALGATASMSQAQAQAAMQTYLTQKRSDWFNAYGVAPEPPAYAAGQAVLNGIITQIESYARSKGWTT